jgi:hypothetical protein
MVATSAIPEDPQMAKETAAVDYSPRLSISLVGNRREGCRRHSAHSGWEVNSEV